MRPTQSPVIVTLPGTEAHDAERRRSAAAAAVRFVLNFNFFLPHECDAMNYSAKHGLAIACRPSVTFVKCPCNGVII